MRTNCTLTDDEYDVVVKFREEQKAKVDQLIKDVITTIDMSRHNTSTRVAQDIVVMLQRTGRVIV